MKSESVINQSRMKQQNRTSVIYALWKNAPISRTGLAKVTGLNKATITSIVASLEEEGMIVPSGSLKGSVGRAQNLLMFNEQYVLCAGILFRPPVMKIAISNIRAKILWMKDLPFSSAQSPMEVLTQVADLLDEGLSTCGAYSDKLLGIGVGTASLLRPDDKMLYAIHSINWRNIPVVEYLQRRFQVPIIADTASNNAILGEKHFGAAKDADNAIYLSVGYGIGGGILMDGQLYRGSNGFAGDLGHYVIDPSGPPCPCGKRGCWEVMASSIATKKSFSELCDAAEQGDGAAVAALAQIGRNLGLGISNLVSIFDPQLVVLGGDVVRAGDLVMVPCRNTVKERVWPWVWERTRIEFSSLSGLVGCLTRVIELLF